MTSQRTTGDDIASLRRALEEEKALRSAEVAALWAAIQRLESREPADAAIHPAPRAIVEVPGTSGIPVRTGSAEPSTRWELVATTGSDVAAEDDILAELLGGCDEGALEDLGSSVTMEDEPWLLVDTPGGGSRSPRSAAEVEPSREERGGSSALLAGAPRPVDEGRHGGSPTLPASAPAPGRSTRDVGAAVTAWESDPGVAPLPLPDGEAGDCRKSEARRRACFVIGDSMVRRGRFWSPDCDIEVWVPPGRNIPGCLRLWRQRIEEWLRRVVGANLEPGLIVLWIGGNDVYPRFRGMELTPVLAGSLWDALKRAILWAARRCPLLIVGPTPRPLFDDSAVWETTAAFEMERALARMVRNLAERSVEFVAVDRRLCRRARTPGTRPDVFSVDTAMFLDDGVHLTHRAYHEVARRLPRWLRVGAGY